MKKIIISDRLAPADSFTSSDLSKAVKLRGDESILEKYPPITIYTMFKQTVEQNPEAKALAFKPRSDPNSTSWIYLNYSEYFEICKNAAKSFISLGLNFHECVAIIGFNAPEWFYSAIGAIFAGLI
jgi:long-chain-fatty-acid--CoA ligase ACSBG